jgi:hypothetical protein
MSSALSSINEFRRRPVAVGIIAAASLALNTACYTYLPVMGGVAPAEGRDAMVELTSEGSATMQPILGPRIHSFEGRVEGTQPDGATWMTVESVTSRDGVTLPFTGGRDAVRVPRDAVVRFNVRELDRRKSWIAAGVVGTLFTAVVVTALEKARSRNSGGPGKIGASPPELRAP